MSTSRSRTSVSSSSRSKSRSGKLESTAELQGSGTEEGTMGSEHLTIPDQLAWQFLSQSQITKFKTLSSHDLTKEMSSILSLTEYSLHLQQAAILDYYVASFFFALENDFIDEQMSAFMTLIHRLLNNIKDKHYSVADNLKDFKSIFSSVGISEYTSLRCFTVPVAHKVINYINTTLIQHYKLYECLFYEQQEDELIQTKLHISLPPDSSTLSPPPLEESVSHDFYNQFIAPPPPSPSPPPPPPQTTQDDSIETMLKPTSKTDLSSALLLNVTPEEVKEMMTQLTKETISSYQDELLHKLNDRETSYKTKFEKLEKALS